MASAAVVVIVLGVGRGAPASLEPFPRGPVVLLHGIRGEAATFKGIAPELVRAGFDPIVVSWRPERPDQHIPEVVAEVIQPALEDALHQRGWADDVPLTFVGHSAGGLLARFLVEQPEADANGWDDRIGWTGDGVPDVSPRWAERSRGVVLLATPNHGSGTGIADWVCRHLPRDPFRAIACDLSDGSVFLSKMGQSAPARIGLSYLSIGASLPLSPAFGQRDWDGDGRALGNDGVVTAESPYLKGASFSVWTSQSMGAHTRLACNDRVVDWAVSFLSAPPEVPERRLSEPGTRARDLCRGRAAPRSVVAGPPRGAPPDRRDASAPRVDGPYMR